MARYAMRVGDERTTAQLADAGAQALVATAMTDGYPWLLGRLTGALGEPYARALERSRARLGAVSASASRSVAARADEVSEWRHRLYDVLLDRPDRVALLRGLVEEASVRLMVVGQPPTVSRTPASAARPPDPALVPVGQATAAGPASARLLAVALLLVVLTGALAVVYAGRF